jgi:hypothetical protein
MPTISITSSGNISEEEALAELTAAGFHGFADDGVGQVEDLHWHDFDAVVYVMSGEASAELADGTIITAGAGTTVRVPRGTVHKDVAGQTYRRVIGFSIPRSEMTEPIDRPVDLLPV